MFRALTNFSSNPTPWVRHISASRALYPRSFSSSRSVWTALRIVILARCFFASRIAYPVAYDTCHSGALRTRMRSSFGFIPADLKTTTSHGASWTKRSTFAPRIRPLRQPPQFPELPSHLAHVGSVDRVDGKRRRDLDYMEKSELRVLDLGHHGAEVDELHPIEVRDRKEDVVPAAVDRQNRLHDLRHADDNLLLLVQIVHKEANPDPAERDDPGNRFDGPKAEGDHELRRDAEHRDDREQRHHIIPFPVGQ